MKLQYRTCSHIKDDGVRCGSPALRNHQFCYYHFRLYDVKNLPGDDDYRMPLLDSYQSIKLMNVQIMRSYLAGSISDVQMRNLMTAIRLALSTERRLNTPYPGDVSREIPRVMGDVLGLSPEVREHGLIDYGEELDPEPDPAQTDELNTSQEPTVHPPETVEAVRKAITSSPALQQLLKKMQGEEKAG